MPYVNIKITREGGPGGTGPSARDKARLIAGVTELLRETLGKHPATTFVVIDEVELEHWGIGGLPVEDYRARQ
ncbi:4-oxalocrotonate tautomerase family protein [Nitratireductor rhodophyticola]|uniref:Tautomerase n=1 Tax=Nitratireductor rhodophyticola TaxID=2854036 RepID=A0ABS7RCS6_9HYPH|nr:4-oxalocrotonate tautomerase family protein [Nitratireductor rhodophyticola]MBY8918724.1 4-oxalocrotonate tautomerase family protein [Nitratireductor rhodophyticola]MBY8920092.1 4-oxalocrotonate tautomerase family protein [Nitratireductor rhodophyticola]MEC9245474.1 4-oxalocrotonate tautomerase family protein [Pseudomonadota bacterium]WPZ13982.1 4-oxalocrotonate tautomerase family protein [Nitratireductor rhodophyticola]